MFSPFLSLQTGTSRFTLSELLHVELRLERESAVLARVFNIRKPSTWLNLTQGGHVNLTVLEVSGVRRRRGRSHVSRTATTTARKVSVRVLVRDTTPRPYLTPFLTLPSRQKNPHNISLKEPSQKNLDYFGLYFDGDLSSRYLFSTHKWP